MKTQAIPLNTAIETSTQNQQPKGKTQMNRIRSLLGEFVSMRHSRIIALGFVLLVVLASSNSFGQTTFRYDANNSGNNQSETLLTTSNVAQLTQTSWSPFPLLSPGPVNTSPVAVGGTVYVLDTGYLYALNAVTGVAVPGFPYAYNTPGSGCPSSPVIGPPSYWSVTPVVFFYDACSPGGGTLYAVYATGSLAGTALWSANVPAGSTAFNAPVIASPTVAFIGTPGFTGVFLAEDCVYAFGAGNGSPLTTWPGGGPNSPCPATGESVNPVYGGTSSSAIGSMYGAGSDTLFVGSSNGSVAINISNGQQLWASPSNLGAVSYSSPSAPLTCEDSRFWLCLNNPTDFVIAGTSTGQIADFDPVHGTSPWQFSISSPPFGYYGLSYNSSPAVATEVINGHAQQIAYVGSSFSYPVTQHFCNLHYSQTATSGYLTALNANTGTAIWQSGLLNPIGFSSPAVANGVVFVADLGDSNVPCVGGQVDGRIYAFDAKGGRPLWSYDLGYIGMPSDEIGSPAVNNGMVFETAGPQLYAFCVPNVSC
jgi:outer membrane protein assembly factor BamB